MKKIAFLLLIIGTFLLVSCESSGPSSEPKSASGVVRANVQINTDANGYTVEQKNIMERLSIWQSEVAGVKASYNLLAADYNSAMSKFNYAFCNVGKLPQGAVEPLPREYKPYIYK
jgi:hypothetical protein